MNVVLKMSRIWLNFNVANEPIIHQTSLPNVKGHILAGVSYSTTDLM